MTGPGAGQAGRGRVGWPRAGLWVSRVGLELEVFYLLFNGQARPKPSPKGAEALLGGRGSRQGPACLWHDWRAPGCHFVTAAVVAGGAGEAEPCAITPTGLDVKAAGGADPGTLRCGWGPCECFLPVPPA